MTELRVLTSWFGERERSAGRPYADLLLDDFAARGIRSSVLLRAIGGFGLEHHLRGDQTLTMSEDPSMAAMAIDVAERIGPLVADLAARQRRGLVTVQDAADLPEDGGETRLSLLLDRHERVGGAPSYVAACELLHRRGVAGASVLLGVDGTVDGVRERARFFGRNAGVPTLVEAVGDAPLLAEVVPELRATTHRLTVAARPVRVLKRDGKLLARPAGATTSWQRLAVYTSESDLHNGEPVHRAVVRRLRSQASQGVTVLRGIRGFHGDHRPHGDRLFQLGRRVPVVTTVVDAAERIADAFDMVDELTREHGLVTVEDVAEVHHPGR